MRSAPRGSAAQPDFRVFIRTRRSHCPKSRNQRIATGETARSPPGAPIADRGEILHTAHLVGALSVSAMGSWSGPAASWSVGLRHGARPACSGADRRRGCGCDHRGEYPREQGATADSAPERVAVGGRGDGGASGRICDRPPRSGDDARAVAPAGGRTRVCLKTNMTSAGALPSGDSFPPAILSRMVTQ